MRAAVAHAVEHAVGQRAGAAAGAATSAPAAAASAVGHRLDHVAHDRRHVHRQPLAVEPLEHPRELRHRAAAHRHRAVAGLAADRRRMRADLLLGDLDRIEARGRRRASVKPPNSPIAYRTPSNSSACSSHEPLGAVAAHVPPRRRARRRSRRRPARGPPPARAGRRTASSRRRPSCRRAPRPQMQPSARARLEGRMGPALARGRDHVDVAVEQQRRSRARARQPRDQVRPLGVARADRASRSRPRVSSPSM